MHHTLLFLSLSLVHLYYEMAIESPLESSFSSKALSCEEIDVLSDFFLLTTNFTN